jgi:hypothetical protein
MELNCLNQFELESKIQQVASLVSEKIELPVFDKQCVDERWQISVMKDGYHYYWCNRGKVVDLNTTLDIDELIYWVFRDATMRLAYKYESLNRVIGQDQRIIAFKKHIEILNGIGIKENYLNKLKNKYNGLLGQKLF